jgi:hypothetical protein
MDCDELHLMLNEKTQPIQWTERPTGALVAAGALWSYLGPMGWSDPAPMTAPIPFGMNSSSSQLLDLLHALRLGHFFFPHFKATH